MCCKVLLAPRHADYAAYVRTCVCACVWTVAAAKGGDGDDSVTGGRARSGSTTSYNFAVGGSASAPAGSPDAPVVAPASSGTSVKPLDSYLQFVRKMYYGESEMGMTGENGGMEVQLFRRTTLGVLTNPVRPRSVMGAFASLHRDCPLVMSALC